MEWVALASSYYLDPKLEGCNASVERMFTRIIAYCGAHETGGKVPKNVHVYVGLARSKRALDALILSGILHERADGWLELASWSKWQKDADDLARLRTGNRERKRKQRKNQEDTSRDKHDDVTRAPHITPQDKTVTSDVGTSPHVGDAGASERPGRPVPTNGWKLVRAVVPASLGQAMITDLSIRSAQMLNEGTSPEDVTACLELWMTKPDAGSGLLPHMLAQVVKTRAPRQAPQGLTSRQRKYLEAELLKDNPDPRAIQLAEENGYGPRPDRAPAPGGPGLRQPQHRRAHGGELAAGGEDRTLDFGDSSGGGAYALRPID